VDPSGRIDLVGGVVAFNEERSLRLAVESLLAQELPPMARWTAIWVVASGCTDHTVQEAHALAARYPEVRVREEPERRGKSAALAEIFRAARGDYLVLLNADARAHPGAVNALLARGCGARRPFGAMGRPEPTVLPGPPVGPMLQLLWQIHHELHQEVVRTGEATHLSDELLLLPLPELPPLPEDVVNDGAFLGAWIAGHGGQLLYVPEARVGIEVPCSFREHQRQRRRIQVGHRQVSAQVGIRPSTISQQLLRHPRRTLRVLSDAVAARPSGWEALTWLVATELAATLGAAWDRLPPRRTYRLWRPIEAAGPATGGRGSRTSGSAGPSDRAG